MLKNTAAAVTVSETAPKFESGAWVVVGWVVGGLESSALEVLL